MILRQGQHKIARRGLMLILSSPSGAGKTTLTRMMLQNQQLDLTLSVSVTTRARRMSEADGIHYNFITRKKFETMREAGELYEWAEVHGNYYGTPRAPVEAVLLQGRDVLFDIDYQGTLQMRDLAPSDVVTIFILPPSMPELRARLERRAEDAPDVIARRLDNARNEISRWQNYDYVLVNEDIEASFLDISAILAAERLKAVRAADGLGEFVASLLAQA